MLAQIFSTVFGFFLLVVVLRKFFWSSIIRLLDDRKKRIEDGLKQIDKMKQELESAKSDYDRRLANIEAETREKIQQAVIEGKKVALEIQDEARTQASAILAKSQETAQMEIAKAKVTLRDEIAEITLSAVEKLIRQKMDADSDRRLVESAIDELQRQAGKG